MTIGLCRITLYLPDSGSLKAKRSILKSLITRIRHKFNVSVSELDSQDLWQKAVVGIAVVTNDTGYANQVLSKAAQLVESEIRVQVLDVAVEMI